MKRLSPERRERILELFAKGWSYYAIHRETGHGTNTIKRICTAAGYRSRPLGYRPKWWAPAVKIGRPRRYTDTQMLAILQQTAAALGRTPRRREMRRPDHKAYIQRFGSWNKAVTLAGLTPRAPGQWFERKPKPVAPAPLDIRDYWRQVDPAVCSAERSEAAPQLANPHPTWTHPYARRSA